MNKNFEVTIDDLYILCKLAEQYMTPEQLFSARNMTRIMNEIKYHKRISTSGEELKCWIDLWVGLYRYAVNRGWIVVEAQFNFWHDKVIAFIPKTIYHQVFGEEGF